MNFTCNINKTDRINRIIIGIGICVAALFEVGKYFYIILGLVLVVEGFIGWCSIPYFITKIKRFIK